MSPTVSGTFILDAAQAKRELRSLRDAAGKTDLSIASLGKTLDGVGSRRQAQQLESYTRSQRTLGNELGSTDRETNRLTSSLGRHEKQMTGVSRAWRGFLAQLKEFKILAVPGKFLAIGTAVAYAVQGVVSLGGGLVSLLPKITDLAKGVAPAVAGFAGLATGAAATMLALGSLQKAMTGNKRALASLTPEARTFLATLKSYKPVLDQLRKASQQGLFPGLTAAVARGASAAPQLSQILRGSGAAVGGAALTVTRGLTGGNTLGDIGSLAKQGDAMIRSLARDFVSLTRIVLNFGMAARPFTQWIIVTTEAWVKHREAISQFNRDSGKTMMQLERTKASLKTFASILGDLWNAFRAIGQAARATGNSLWGSMEKAAHAWRDMLSSPQEQVRLRAMFAAMRVDVEAIARLFVALEHGILGVRAQGNTFAQMTDKLTAAIPSISKLLSNILTTFGPTLANVIKTLGDVLGGVSGWIGPWNILLTTINGIVSGIDWLSKKLPALGGLIKDVLAIALITRFAIKLGLIESAWWRIGRAATVAGAAETRAMSGGGGGIRGAAGRFGFGYAAGRGGAATGFRDAAGMGRLTQLGAGAGRLARGISGAGLPILAGSIAASFLPGRAGSIGQSAAAGAGLGLMFGPEGAAIGGALGAGAGFLMSRQDPGQQQAAQVGKSLQAGLGVLATYPTALGRMQAELNLYQSAAKQLADNHSQAAQAEIAQIQQAIQARRGEIAALKQEAAMRKRAESIASGRWRANDLDRQMRILLGRGVSRAQAALQVGARGVRQVQSLPAGKGRQELAKAIVAKFALEEKSIPQDAGALRAMTQQLLQFLPGGGAITAPGRQYKGTMHEVAQANKTFARVGGPAGSEALLEQAVKPTTLQATYYAIIRAMGYPVKVAMAEAMSTDQTGKPPDIAAFIRSQATGGTIKGLAQRGGIPSFGSRYKGLAQAPTGPHGWVTDKVADPGGSGGVRVRWSDGTVQIVSPKAAAKMQYASGGRVGGGSMYDNTEIGPGMKAGAGELVVNRHTERKVDQMLGGRASLGQLVGHETRAHTANFAHGGSTSGLQPGISSIADLMLTQFPGLSITSTVRPGDKGSYHSIGEAVDLAGAPNLMQRAGAWAGSTLGSSLLEGIHNTSLSIKNGAAVAPSFWGEKTWGAHRNHIHLASSGGAPGSPTGPGGKPGASAMSAIGARPLGVEASQARTIAAIQGFSPMATSTATKTTAPASNGGSPAVAPSGGGGSNRALGKQMMLGMGWDGLQWPSLEQLWTGESNWNAKAMNPSSGATGIPQALPGWKMQSAGPDWRTNPATQIQWGLDYIKGRYGSPMNAYSTWLGRSPHWYGSGGRTPAWGGWHANGGSFTADGPTLIGVGEKGRENVTVTPAGKGRGGFSPVVNVNVYGGNPAEVEMAVERALMKVASHLETTGTDLEGDDF